MPRQKLKIDKEKVEQLASFGCTTSEIGSFFGCDEGTIRNRFSENLTKGKEKGKIRLRQMQWKAADKGNVTMLIWLGKQLLGQADKSEVTWENPVDGVEFIDV